MLLLIVVSIATGLFAGAAIYVSAVEHPARVSCGTEVAVREFGPSYKRGAVMQAPLALLAGRREQHAPPRYLAVRIGDGDGHLPELEVANVEAVERPAVCRPGWRVETRSLGRRGVARKRIHVGRRQVGSGIAVVATPHQSRARQRDDGEKGAAGHGDASCHPAHRAGLAPTPRWRPSPRRG